jgi:hypothetical protein
VGLEEVERTPQVKQKPQPKDEGPRCGSCYYFHTEDGEVGECYANPPVTELDEDDSAYNVRPVITRDEFPCRHFRAKQ